MILPVTAILMSATISEGKPLTDLDWGVIRSSSEYTLQVSRPQGDAVGDSIVIESAAPAGQDAGGAIASVTINAEGRYRATITALLTSEDAEQGAAVWVRAGGPGRVSAFSTSARFPVAPTTPAAKRVATVLIPQDAKELVFGIVMRGPGRLVAENVQVVLHPEPGESIDPTHLLKSAIEVTREHALYANRVDWDGFAPKLLASARDAKAPEDTYIHIRTLLRVLADGHSFHIDRNTALQHELMGAPREQPVVRVLPLGIGYIYVPAFAGRNDIDSASYLRGIFEQIRAAAPNAANGWIVDLRGNTGGNVWPMLGSLKSLLGGEYLGDYRDVAGGLTPWKIDEEIPWIDLTTAKVAVLIGDRTSSAGEATAIAFSGRPRTRTFGEPSAGRPTGNKSFKLPDGSLINLTTALARNRHGDSFEGPVIPDEIVYSGSVSEGDRIADAARRWLLSAEE